MKTNRFGKTRMEMRVWLRDHYVVKHVRIQEEYCKCDGWADEPSNVSQEVVATHRLWGRIYAFLSLEATPAVLAVDTARATHLLDDIWVLTFGRAQICQCGTENERKGEKTHSLIMRQIARLNSKV